ncbi:hypothetical protein HELRODRAFT_167144 [Helobdella robusta]|uniref:Arrestin C-terminal-like domain-containing protein n=1 Tax=Helobdella robusta TaxID=6412 RepID=T1EZ26_HELRO|nr:hypothetical protein HELRODRAFT_167144 [Helobdella robusta]ESO10636.1 hypothetical protein HELRODRAFT_167144 [Helobdella robusta]
MSARLNWTKKNSELGTSPATQFQNLQPRDGIGWMRYKNTNNQTPNENNHITSTLNTTSSKSTSTYDQCTSTNAKVRSTDNQVTSTDNRTKNDVMRQNRAVVTGQGQSDTNLKIRNFEISYLREDGVMCGGKKLAGHVTFRNDEEVAVESVLIIFLISHFPGWIAILPIFNPTSGKPPTHHFRHNDDGNDADDLVVMKHWKEFIIKNEVMFSEKALLPIEKITNRQNQIFGLLTLSDVRGKWKVKKTGFFPGESIEVHADIFNGGRVKVVENKVTLVQHILYKSHRCPDNQISERKKLSTKCKSTILTDAWGFWRDQIPIPSNATPTTNKIAELIELSIKLAPPLKPIRSEIDIIIGNLEYPDEAINIIQNINKETNNNNHNNKNNKNKENNNINNNKICYNNNNISKIYYNNKILSDLNLYLDDDKSFF